MRKLLSLLGLSALLVLGTACKKDMEVIDMHYLDYTIVNTGDYITDMEFMDENNGVMVAYDEIFFTYDGGLTWNNGFSLNNYELVCFTRPSLDTAYTFWQYSSSSAIKCYRTVNGGVAWSQVSTMGETCAASFYSGSRGLAISKVNNNVYNVWRSNNSGQNWNMPYISPFMSHFVAFDAQNFFGYVYGGPAYKSSDGGATITNVFNNANGCIKLVMLPTVQRGFILDEDGDIYTSSDYGSTWNLCMHDSGGAAIAYMDAHESGLVVAVGYGHILISRDFGSTWNYYQFRNPVEMVESRFYCVEILNSNTFYVSEDGMNSDNQLIRVTIP